MAEYTKGEWRLTPYHYGQGYLLEAGGAAIGEIKDVSEANAWLIASAPKLYEALREIKHLIDTHELSDVVLSQLISEKCFQSLAQVEEK